MKQILSLMLVVILSLDSYGFHNYKLRLIKHSSKTVESKKIIEKKYVEVNVIQPITKKVDSTEKEMFQGCLESYEEVEASDKKKILPNVAVHCFRALRKPIEIKAISSYPSNNVKNKIFKSEKALSGHLSGLWIVVVLLVVVFLIFIILGIIGLNSGITWLATLSFTIVAFMLLFTIAFIRSI